MSEKGVEAVDRALTILGAFLRGNPSLSLHEIADATGYYKSTILRLIVSLERSGYLRRGDDMRYRLGPTCAALGAAHNSAFSLAEVLRPAIRDLAVQSGETASFYILDGRERVCLFRQNSNHAIRHHVNEGDRLPVDAGAAGAVLLAFSHPEDARWESVRNDGYALSLGERDPDAAAVSAPVIDSSQKLIGALSISGLKSRFTPSAIESHLRILRDVLSQIKL